MPNYGTAASPVTVFHGVSRAERPCGQARMMTPITPLLLQRQPVESATPLPASH